MSQSLQGYANIQAMTKGKSANFFITHEKLLCSSAIPFRTGFKIKPQQCVTTYAQLKLLVRLYIDLSVVFIADTKFCASRRKLSKLFNTVTTIICKVVYEENTTTVTCENQKPLLPHLWDI